MISEYPLRTFPLYLSMDTDEGFVPSTEEDFTAFCIWVDKYLKLLGLTDWFVSFAYLENAGSESACVSYDYESRTATFIFGKRIKVHFKKEYFLAVLAAHEALHLLFSEFDYALKKGVSPDQLEAVEHGVVRRLERILAANCGGPGSRRFDER